MVGGDQPARCPQGQGEQNVGTSVTRSWHTRSAELKDQKIKKSEFFCHICLVMRFTFCFGFAYDANTGAEPL